MLKQEGKKEKQMEEIKTDVVTPTPTETQPNNEGLLTQEQFDNALNSKVARVKNNLAKDLGLESYSKETIESYIAKNKEAQSTIATMTETEKTLNNTILDNNFNLEALGLGITPDNVARAIKLAKVELSGNSELNVDTALALVVKDFPFFAGGEVVPPLTKVGAVVNNTATPKNEIDDYLKRNYANSKYVEK